MEKSKTSSPVDKYLPPSSLVSTNMELTNLKNDSLLGNKVTTLTLRLISLLNAQKNSLPDGLEASMVFAANEL